MGTAYFLVIIATGLAGLWLLLRKTNAHSYLHGSKDDALDLQELRKAYRRNEIEHPVVEAYIDRYMSSQESKADKTEWRENLGVAYMANESMNDDSDQRIRAVH